MEKIIGRIHEKKIIDTIYSKLSPQLVAIYGRRRVGKTFLIRNSFSDKGFYFEVTGIKKGPIEYQIGNFVDAIADSFLNGEVPKEKPKNWMEAFSLLKNTIRDLRKNSEAKITLFFDELPWLATSKSNFIALLDHFYNNFITRQKNIIVVICGSAASWMIDNIINSKGGLHARVTKEICLTPLGISEAENYLSEKGVHYDKKQLIEIYMALGGVPFYLDYIQPGLSAAQNINNLFFKLNAPLKHEFHRIFRSLFDNYEFHIAIIRELVKKPSGLTQTEIVKLLKTNHGHQIVKILNELYYSGFIMPLPNFKRTKKNIKYRLIDEFSAFSFHWLQDVDNYAFLTLNEDFWIKSYMSQQYKIWSGFSFENFCLKHIALLKKALGISAVLTKESVWNPSLSKDGHQIDLVIDRADNCINLCEMKFYKSNFTVDKKYAEWLIKRKELFINETGTKKTVFTTLITTYGVKKSSNLLNSVDISLSIEDIFQTVV